MIYNRDTSGSERFHSLPRIYYRNSSACILVIDNTNASLGAAKRWIGECMQQIRELGHGHDSQSDIPYQIIVAHNKDDLHADLQQVSVVYAYNLISLPSSHPILVPCIPPQ
jgi:GTPase SAR1 family protein